MGVVTSRQYLNRVRAQLLNRDGEPALLAREFGVAASLHNKNLLPALELGWCRSQFLHHSLRSGPPSTEKHTAAEPIDARTPQHGCLETALPPGRALPYLSNHCYVSCKTDVIKGKGTTGFGNTFR